MKNTDFNLLAKKAFENAKAKGFHDKPCTDAHCVMLVACELAEAVEADREGRRSDRRTYNFLLQEYGEPLEKHLFEKHIKDTVEDELADAVIRLLDFAGMKAVLEDAIWNKPAWHGDLDALHRSQAGRNMNQIGG